MFDVLHASTAVRARWSGLALITEKLKAVPARDKAEQAKGMEDIGVLFCLLLFGT